MHLKLWMYIFFYQLLNILHNQILLNVFICIFILRYSSEWEHVVGRMGRWIDFKNDYKSMYPW